MLKPFDAPVSKVNAIKAEAQHFRPHSYMQKQKKKIAVVFGTRPEAIKLAPVILALNRHKNIKCRVCVTGQHREMLDQVMGIFGINPDRDLDLMLPDQTLAGLTAKTIKALDDFYTEEKPELVVVQGDTTTVFCAALSAFYHHIPVGHIEAGLRTWDMQSPWPEEANRVLTSRLATYHFAPTESSRQNLRDEGVEDSKIYVTGNTVIDALFLALEKVHENPPDIPGLPDPTLGEWEGRPLVLITAHRRESFGGGFENICHAISRLASEHPDCQFVYPVHLNPNVREPVERLLYKGKASNIHLIDPLTYLRFVRMMERATLILTDSGGVQEEAPSLGTPVLVMRDTTERPEAVDAGTAKLVGTDTERIIERVSELLAGGKKYESMAKAINPYGEGQASERIINILQEKLTNATEAQKRLNE